MPVRFSNNASATLASAITSSGTAITVTSGQGAKFPSVNGSNYFFATLVDASNNVEIVKCTSRVNDLLTVLRAQDGTSARAFPAGSIIELRLNAAALNALVEEQIGEASGVALVPTGAIAATNVQDAIAELETEKLAKSGGTMTGQLTLENSLLLSASGSKIRGDMSTGTHGNRVAFQTSTSNAVTAMSVIPNGSGTGSQWNAYSSSLPGSSAYGSLQANTSDVRLESAKTGTALYLPLCFYTNNAERFRISTTGALGIGGANFGTSGQILTSAGPDDPPTWTTINTDPAAVTPGDSTVTYAKLSATDSVAGMKPRVARAWIQFNATGNTVSITADYNIIGTSYNAVGRFSFNIDGLQVGVSNAGCAVASASNAYGSNSRAWCEVEPVNTGFFLETRRADGNLTNFSKVSVIVMGTTP